MSVMSNVREESLESQGDSMPILTADQYASDAADLTLPEDLRWRPSQLQSDSQSSAGAAKPFRQKSSVTWLDALYIALALTISVVCVSQILSALSG